MTSIRFRLRALLPAASLLLILGGCGGDDSPRAELKSNRALWRSQGITDYRFVFQKSCFCGPDAIKPLKTDVRGGVPVRVEAVDDGRLLPARYTMTVEEIFDRIEAAIDGGYEHLDVRYDNALGYPVSVEMNPGGNVADAGLGIDCSNLTRLDAVVSCPPPPPIGPCDCDAAAPAIRYQYTAWGDSGDVVASGCVVMTFTPNDGGNPAYPYRISGNRCISLRCQGEPSAHHGAVDVGGSISDNGDFYLDLNSGWADFNVFLNATGVAPGNPYISGDWTESHFTGPVASGTFLLEIPVSTARPALTTP